MQKRITKPWLLAAASFGVFIAIRLAFLAFPDISATMMNYADSYAYYVPAGIAYMHGTPINQLFPFWYPPLAKYIIGFFAMYLNSPAASSVLFGGLVAVVGLLISREFVAEGKWAAAAVWIMSFDIVGIGVSVYPDLEIFMIFFALLAIYTGLTRKSKLSYLGTGVFLGLAMACKWTALLFVVPIIAWLLIQRKFSASGIAILGALASYIAVFLPLIISQGFGSFVQLQLYMLGSGTGLITNVRQIGGLSVPSFYTALSLYLTTYVQASPSFFQPAHPEAVWVFGIPFYSFAERLNAPLILAFFPTLYLTARKYLAARDGKHLLALLVLLSLEIGGSYFTQEPWLYAPVSIMLAILVPQYLEALSKRGAWSKAFVWFFLCLQPVWILFAYSIDLWRLILIRVATGVF